MQKWSDSLNYNPVSPLLNCGDKSISLFARRDLTGEKVSVHELWQIPDAQKILRRQKSNGSWHYPGGNEKIRTAENYNQLESYRNLGVLVEAFGFDNTHSAIKKAAEYLFSFQSREGDFRGIYGSQFSPNYSAGIGELLIKAGYEDHPAIKKMFSWLLTIRQKDGGWTIPFRTRKYKIDAIVKLKKPVDPDATKPFSHLITGVVLRAFAAHPYYKNTQAAGTAGKLLLSSLFKKDNYPDRGGVEYWTRFSFPFWFTDLISAMDSLSLLGYSKQEPQIDRVLQWFIKNQQKDGLWDLKILKGQNKGIIRYWLSLAICRIFKRFFS